MDSFADTDKGLYPQIVKKWLQDSDAPMNAVVSSLQIILSRGKLHW